MRLRSLKAKNSQVVMEAQKRGPNTLAVGTFLYALNNPTGNEGYYPMCYFLPEGVSGLNWLAAAMGNVSSRIVTLSNSYPRVMPEKEMYLLVMDLGVNRSFTPLL
ncbi:hypothetical protein Tco_1012462 [Tanacetum coccineum]